MQDPFERTTVTGAARGDKAIALGANKNVLRVRHLRRRGERGLMKGRRVHDDAFLSIYRFRNDPRHATTAHWPRQAPPFRREEYILIVNNAITHRATSSRRTSASLIDSAVRRNSTASASSLRRFPSDRTSSSVLTTPPNQVRDANARCISFLQEVFPEGSSRGIDCLRLREIYMRQVNLSFTKQQISGR